MGKKTSCEIKLNQGDMISLLQQNEIDENTLEEKLDDLSEFSVEEDKESNDHTELKKRAEDSADKKVLRTLN